MVAAVSLAACRQDRAGEPAAAPVTPTTTTTAPPPPQQGHGGPGYPKGSRAVPTAEVSQSKLWFHDGLWWAVMTEPAAGEFRVHWLDAAAQAWVDTGTLVDPRPFARPDVLWDGGRLYVVAAGPGPGGRNAARLARFSYDPAARRYTLDPDFPVSLTTGGVDSPVLAKAPSGRLWLAYIAGDRLQVDHSVGGDVRWSGPFVPPGPLPEAAPQAASIVTVGDEVAVLWVSAADGSLLAATARDAEPRAPWSVTTVLPGAPAPPGGRRVERTLSVRSAPGEGRLVAAVDQAPPPGGGANPLAARISLAVRAPDGRWATYLVSRVADAQRHPVVVLDVERRAVAVVTASDAAVTYKESPLDGVAFPPGAGAPLVVVPGSKGVAHPTTTKQPATAEAGLVVLAADEEAGRYLHASLGAAAQSPAAPGVRPAQTGENDVVRDSFDALPAGPPGDGWSLTSEDKGAAVAVVARPDGGGNALQVRAGPTRADARACKRFPETAAGGLRLETEVNVAPGHGETVLAAVRGRAEVASVRLREDRRLAWFDGPAKVASDVRLRPGVWYRIALVLDVGARRWAVEVGPSGGGGPLVRRTGLAWRVADAVFVDRACFQSPSPAGFLVDNLSVRRQP